jgi:hypothetical protein
MKSFISGLLVGLFFLIIFTIPLPAYLTMQQRAKSLDILLSIEPIKKEVEQSLLLKKAIEPKTINNINKYILFVKIKNDGTIIIKATDQGQLFILTPSITNSEVTWDRMGGPNKDMPAGEWNRT